MKRFLLLFSLLISIVSLNAQITWDGGGDGISWSDANNWISDILPASTDNVILDNSSLGGNYAVTLPNTLVTIVSITITPNAGNTITLTLPLSNTLQPGLTFNGPGNVLVLNNGGVFKNSTGSASSTPPPISIGTMDSIRINNGGRFIQNTVGAHVYLLDQLSTAPGTETGIFEFDVPGASGYIISLTDRKYGTLMLTALASGGMKTYTGSGAMDLIIRGDFLINTGATLISSMTANINIAGNLSIVGTFDNTPSSGLSGRSILFTGTSNQIVSGFGIFSFGVNFRNIEVNAGSTVTLQRGINLSNAGNSFIVNTNGTLQTNTNIINGAGIFQLITGGWLGIGSGDGITTTPTTLGNIQTGTRTFSTGASYEYNSGIGVVQTTGNGLPATIFRLKINTDAGMGTSGVTLSQNTVVSGVLDLTKGKLTTSSSVRLTIGNVASAINYTLADNSFVNGPLHKTGNTSFIFPVGKGVTIHPVGLVTTTGNTGDLTAGEYFTPGTVCSPQTYGGGIHHTSGLEYWTLGRGNMGGGAFSQVTLYATTLSDATDRTRLVVARCELGTGWTNLGNDDVSTVGSFGTVTSLMSIPGSFPSTTVFTLASLDAAPVNPLPIDLITFDATKLSSTKSLIEWELAACCSSAAKFEVQRAGANKAFTTIGIAGGSETNRLYTFTDNGLQTGINYYRLKMIDVDGTVTYTQTVAVMNGVKGLLLTSLLPTIINNTAILTITSSASAKLDLIIIDMQGRVMVKQNYLAGEGNTTIQLSMEKLAPGVYQLIGVTSEGKTNTVSFLKQ